MYACNVDIVFVFKQKTAYEVRISDWSSDVCSSDLHAQYLEKNRHIRDAVRQAMQCLVQAGGQVRALAHGRRRRLLLSSTGPTRRVPDSRSCALLEARQRIE